MVIVCARAGAGVCGRSGPKEEAAALPRPGDSRGAPGVGRRGRRGGCGGGSERAQMGESRFHGGRVSLIALMGGFGVGGGESPTRSCRRATRPTRTA